MSAIPFEKIQITDRHDETSDKAFQNLLSWVRENSKGKQKTSWESVKLDRNTLTNGDGVVVAKSKITKGIKFAIPPECVLTQDKVFSSIIGKLFSGRLRSFLLLLIKIIRFR